MARYRILLVDDEAPARRNLRLALDGQADWTVVGECDSAAAARDWLGVNEADLVFVDVQMPGENGVRFSRWLAQRTTPPIIVFATAYDSFAIEAFEAHALDYLLKPFDDARLQQTLERAAHWLTLQQRHAYAGAVVDLAADRQAQEDEARPRLTSLNVRSLRRIERVLIDDVIWIGSAGNYVELHLATRCVLHRAPLGWIEQRIDPAQFLRVHRTAIVRRSAISEFRSSPQRGPEVRLDNGDWVGLSPKGTAAVRDWLRSQDAGGCP